MAPTLRRAIVSSRGDARYKKTLTWLTREVCPLRRLADLAKWLCVSVVEELEASYGLVALRKSEPQGPREPIEQGQTWHAPTASLEAGDDSLRGAGPHGDLGLGETRSFPSLGERSPDLGADLGLLIEKADLGGFLRIRS